MYRVTPHGSTQKSPSELLIGRNIRCPIDLWRPETRNVVKRNQEKQKVYHKGMKKYFAIGENVLVKDYRKNHDNWIQCKILTKPDNRNVLVQPNNESSVWKRHYDQVKPMQQGWQESPPKAVIVNEKNSVESNSPGLEGGGGKNEANSASSSRGTSRACIPFHLPARILMGTPLRFGNA